jgi:hypothetical protein
VTIAENSNGFCNSACTVSPKFLMPLALYSTASYKDQFAIFMPRLFDIAYTERVV